MRDARAPGAASALFHDGLTAALRGNQRRATDLYLAAWRANPEFLAALLSLGNLSPFSYPDTVLRALDSAALRAGGPLLMHCARQVLSPHFRSIPIDSFAHSGNRLIRRCGSLVQALYRPSPHDTDIWRQHIQSPSAAAMYLEGIERRDPAAALEEARALAHSRAHPMVRLQAYGVAIFALHRLGRDDEARTWEAALRQLGRQWGAEVHVLRIEAQHVALMAHVASDSASSHLHAVVARARHDMSVLFPRLHVHDRALELSQRGVNQLDSGQLADAVGTFDRLIALADSVQDPGLAAYAHGRRGRALVKLGRHDEARRSLLRGRELGERSGNVTALREVSHDLLHLYEALGQPDSAVAAGRAFASYSDRLMSPATRIMAHRDLGWLHRRAGQRALAHREFSAMVAAIDELQQQAVWAAEYYEYIGDLDRARHYYALEKPSGPDRGRALSGLVRVSEALGDVQRAMEYARAADRDTLSWFPEYTLLLPGVMARNGRLEEARELLRAGRHRAMASGKVHGMAQLALESAEVELQLGSGGTAAALADSARTAATQVGATEIAVRARALAALAALEMGVLPAEALARLRRAVAQGDRMRVPQLSAALHQALGDGLRRAGDVRAALREYAIAAAWVDSIAARWRTDSDRATYLGARVRVTNRALAAIVQDLRLSDRAAQYAYWSTRRKGGDAASAGRMLRELRRPDPHTAIVDFTVMDTAVAALVVTSDGATIHRLPVTSDSLAPRVARFLAPIAPRIGSAVDAGRIGFDSVAASQLYADLVAPIRGALTGRTRLAIVPDGYLHGLPFDALVPGSDAGGGAGGGRRYLIDDFVVRYAMSLDTRFDELPNAQSRTALAVVGWAPAEDAGVAAEIAAVTEMLGGRVQVLADAGAVRLALASPSRRPDIVHFATHAEANDANPDYARLSLGAPSDGRGSGEWLHAFEIRDARLDGALVVLSACRTAAGRVVSEGSLSLSRAFFQAGAGATIATLWPVGEPTAELMRSFYRRMVDGAPVDDALRAARLEFRRSRSDHPFHWAPFVLTTR